MTQMEKVELWTITLVVTLLAVVSDYRWSVAFGNLMAYSAALLLAQGLVRDVARIVARRLRGEESQARHRLMCLCAESTVGLLFVVLGVGLTLIGIRQPVVLPGLAVAAIAAGVLVFGFLAKDYVISIRKEKDHASIIVW